MASIDGLVSGLNTTDIIKQLMQLERQPQARLQAKQSVAEAAIGALRSLNTRFAAIATAAAKLGGGSTTTLPTDWSLATATSSDTRVAATAISGAVPGSVTLSVEQLAKAGWSLSSGSTATPSEPGLLPPDSSIWLSKGAGDPVEVKVGDGSLNAIVSAINGSGAGVSATRVQLVPGQYTLQLSSTTSGKDTGVRVETAAGSGVDPFSGTVLGGVSVQETGQDAELLVFGQRVTRASNTVSDLLQGVTLTLTEADPGVDVTVVVARDTDGVAGRVSSMVDAINAALSDVKAVTGYDLETKSKGKLYGDQAVRGLTNRLANAVIGDGSSSAGLAGISVGRDGTVTFDRTKFLAALEKDPAAVEAVLGEDGLAGRVHALADTVSRSQTAAGGPGLLANAITSRESQVSTLKAGISSWDNRLELREATLKRQYAALEKALGASQSQGQWLAGQIAGLPRWS